MSLRLAISVLLLATALTGCASGRRNEPAADAPSPQPSLPVATIVTTVPVAAHPLGFAQVDGQLWVFSQSQQRASVIDPRTARVLRTVPLPGLGAGYPATAGGAVWVPDLAGTTRSVWQVDPAAGGVTRR